MRKMRIVTTLSIFVLLVLIVSSCDFSMGGGIDNKSEAESIEIDSTSVKEAYEVGEVDLTTIFLKVTNKDGKKYICNLNSSYLSNDDLALLNVVGTHKLKIILDEASTILTITIVQTVHVYFYDASILLYTFDVSVGGTLDEIPLPPQKEGLHSGWSVDDFSNIQSDLYVYTRYWTETSSTFNKALYELDELFNIELVEESITLPKSIDGITITYSSDSINFTNSGRLKRDYEPSVAHLTVLLTHNNESTQKTYTLNLAGYQDLYELVASSYVYRNYGMLTKEFFNTMDIIYCSFIEIDADGGFIGLDAGGESVEQNNKSVNNKISNYVIPYAKEKGIYVIPSLGGGAYSTSTFKKIAESDTLRKKFAQNIVDLINIYGYDGIDIDWETPGSSHSKYFTLMMAEINKAVKANSEVQRRWPV